MKDRGSFGLAEMIQMKETQPILPVNIYPRTCILHGRILPPRRAQGWDNKNMPEEHCPGLKNEKKIIELDAVEQSI